ncbi:hypothetical protein ACHAW6_002617 [Cyclotella cf. meneghiniana]
MKVDAEAPPISTTEPEDSSSYPYNQLLQQLESKAYQALSQPPQQAFTNEPTAEGASPESTPWDLSHDALLATLLHEFSNHIVQRTREVSLEIRKLQSSVNKVGVDVAFVQNEWMKSSRGIFMEHVVSDDDGNEKIKTDSRGGMRNEKDQKETDLGSDHDDDSAAEIARLEAEEQAAIRDGMKALSLFFDPKQSRKTSENAMDDELGFDGDDADAYYGDNDIIGDDCYYYPSAKDDAFNQRPLPFIVGSREFMESSCAGLGGEAGESTDVVNG